jgi:hypothetical protein
MSMFLCYTFSKILAFANVLYLAIFLVLGIYGVYILQDTMAVF